MEKTKTYDFLKNQIFCLPKKIKHDQDSEASIKQEKNICNIDSKYRIFILYQKIFHIKKDTTTVTENLAKHMNTLEDSQMAGKQEKMSTAVTTREVTVKDEPSHTASQTGKDEKKGQSPC